MSKDAKRRLYEVLLDEATLPRLGTDQDHERAVAIFDLVEENSFALRERDDGPYSLTVAQLDAKLNFIVRNEAGEAAADFAVSMTPFRTASPREIEAIDRERTGLHNEGAELLATRLADKVDIDRGTARRLFTLISALHWK